MTDQDYFDEAEEFMVGYTDTVSEFGRIPDDYSEKMFWMNIILDIAQSLRKIANPLSAAVPDAFDPTDLHKALEELKRHKDRLEHDYEAEVAEWHPPHTGGISDS